MHDLPTDANLAIFDEDELDEASAHLLDLHFVSIIQQHERKQPFLLHPNVALQDEINTHEGYIAFASSLICPVQQHIIARFQNLVTYGERPTDPNTPAMEHSAENATELNAPAMHEYDLVDLDVAVLRQVNEPSSTDLNAQQELQANATELNAPAMNELEWVNLDVAVSRQENETVLQQENEANATDLSAPAMNALDLVDLDVVVLRQENDTVLLQENEMNATDLNAPAMNELDLVDLDVGVLRQENETYATDSQNMALLPNAPVLLNTNNAKDILLMLRHRPHHDEDEHPMIPNNDVESRNPHAQLEDDEQKAYDHEMGLMDHDIRRHLNDETECIIESFEKLDNSNSDNNSESHDFYRHSPNSSGDDMDENTDTEDGAEDLIDLLQSNMKLLAFITKQNATIRRLRSRITRLANLVSTLENIMRGDATARQESLTPNTISPDDGPRQESKGSTIHASSVVESRSSTLHASSVMESDMHRNVRSQQLSS